MAITIIFTLLQASEQARSKIASLKETLEDVTEVKDITIDNDKEEEDKETKDEGETEIKEQIKEKETKGSAGNPEKVSVYRLIYTVL